MDRLLGGSRRAQEIVECPAIPGCVSQGATRGEALENVKDAIAACLAVRSERGRRWYRGCDGAAAASTKNILDGLSATTYNGSNNFNDVSFGSEHPGGCHFVMCDAAVRFVTDNVAIVVYKATASADGSEAQVVDK